MAGVSVRVIFMFLFASLILAANTGRAAMINEVRITQSGPDTNDFWELAGAPNESLAGLWLINISGEFNPGLINFAYDLSSYAIPADGYFLAHRTDSSADIVTGHDYFNTPPNFLLVSGFTGAVNDDIDADNDGTPELNGGVPYWTSVIDGVFLTNVDGKPDIAYGGASVVGPDSFNSQFSPAHAFRSPDGTGPWVVGLFADLSFDTPGAANVPAPATLFLIGLGLAGLGLAKRRRPPSGRD